MITYEGAGYPFDTSFEKVTHEEWVQVKDKLHLTIRGVVEGIEQLDIDAITALYWLTMRSDGQHDGLVLARNLDFSPVQFMAAWADAEEDEPEPDPTRDGSLPDTTTPASTGSSAGTSGKSPSSTSSRSPGTAGSASGKSGA